MNTNPNARQILCFGDSNTWGCVPTPNHDQRYAADVRWPGALQKLLGDNFEVINEGLNGRTTCLDDPKPGREDKNGLVYLVPCLESHDQLDLVILALGINDLKERFSQSAEQVGENINMLIGIIQDPNSYSSGKVPRILLLAPPIVDETNPFAIGNYKGATAKAKELGAVYARVAQKRGTLFCDLAKLVSSSTVDGLHLEAEAHKAIAEKVYQLSISQI